MNKVTLSVIILAFVASSMTLWLLESPSKYMLYFFEIALIVVMRAQAQCKPYSDQMTLHSTLFIDRSGEEN